MVYNSLTAWIGQPNVPVEIDAALNERDYGDLNGLDKDEAIKKYGKDKV